MFSTQNLFVKVSARNLFELEGEERARGRVREREEEMVREKGRKG